MNIDNNLVSSIIKNKDYIKGMGSGLLSFLFFILFFEGLSFFLGLRLSIWVPVAAFFLSLVGSLLSGGWKAALGLVIFIGISIAFSFLSFDTAYDSLTYHETTICYLIEGWNPVFEYAFPESLWSKHYARAQELLGSSIAFATGYLETGKSVSLMFILASLFLAFYFLKNLWRQLSNNHILIVTIILIINPVVLSQITTFYNDLFLYPGLVVLFLSLLDAYKNCRGNSISWFDWIIALMFTAILINTKFTHFFYCGLVWIGFLIMGIINGRKGYSLRIIMVASFALIIGVIWIGWNPYITNLINTGDPFYPLLTGDVDIMSSNTPDIYNDDNRFVNFFKSQLSTETDAWILITHPLNFKNYFATTLDSRTLGFGALFLPLFLLSVYLMIKTKAPKNFVIVYLLSIVSCFIFSQAWWARYAPMIWATLGISVLYSFISHKCVIVRKIIIAGTLINLILVGIRSNTQSIIGRIQWQNFIEYSKNREIKVSLNGNEVMRRHLKEHDINYIDCPPDNLNISNTYTIIGNPKHEMVIFYEVEYDYQKNLSPIRKVIFNYSKIKKD